MQDKNKKPFPVPAPQPHPTEKRDETPKKPK